MHITQGDSLEYRSFNYDDKNRLIAILDSGNNGIESKIFITYNIYGNVSTLTHANNIAAGGPFIDYTITVEYDDKGRPIRIRSTGFGQVDFISNTYTYDSLTRVVIDSTYNNLTKQVEYIFLYSYDENTRLRESKGMYYPSGLLLFQRAYEYDDHPNPMWFGVPSYLLGGDYCAEFGKNNLIKLTDRNGVVNYTYEYDGNGLPTKCSVRSNSGPLTTYIDYYYE